MNHSTGLRIGIGFILPPRTMPDASGRLDWRVRSTRRNTRGNTRRTSRHSRMSMVARLRSSSGWHERDRAGAISNVIAWTSFRYVPGATTASPPGRVVAYLPPRQYGERECTCCGKTHFDFKRQQYFRGESLLFADGSVSWETPDEFEKVLNEQVTNGMARTRHRFPIRRGEGM